MVSSGPVGQRLKLSLFLFPYLSTPAPEISFGLSKIIKIKESVMLNYTNIVKNFKHFQCSALILYRM
jgi:hypothetical protein